MKLTKLKAIKYDKTHFLKEIGLAAEKQFFIFKIGSKVNCRSKFKKCNAKKKSLFIDEKGFVICYTVAITGNGI